MAKGIGVYNLKLSNPRRRNSPMGTGFHGKDIPDGVSRKVNGLAPIGRASRPFHAFEHSSMICNLRAIHSRVFTCGVPNAVFFSKQSLRSGAI